MDADLARSLSHAGRM